MYPKHKANFINTNTYINLTYTRIEGCKVYFIQRIIDRIHSSGGRVTKSKKWRCGEKKWRCGKKVTLIIIIITKVISLKLYNSQISKLDRKLKKLQSLDKFWRYFVYISENCILNSAPKSCELDPIPSKLLIECLDSILPSLTDLFNSSLASGIFPQSFKSALVIPILKKRCLDHNDLNNYRPVSNLCFIAKILEKLVLSQVSSYLKSHNLYNTCQSAYRPGHSTETALLKVVNDLFLSLNKGNISVLALLDFSSAFDTIDHTI